MTEVWPIDGERICLALAAILSSQTFARSERLRAFLRFVVEHEQLGLAHQLKGYTIGMDVFSRDGALDPGVDALVRVQAGKLRRLLNLYYADEGRNDPVRIRIPLGAYVPVYEWGPDVRRALDSAFPSPSAIDMSGADAIGIEREAGAPDRHPHALPHIYVTSTSGSDCRAKTFDNALRMSETRLHGFKLAPQETALPAQAGDLDFLLSIESPPGNGRFSARLDHPASGETLTSRSRQPGTTVCNRQVAAFANQFAAETMTLCGEVYAFCRRHRLSSALMDCLEATYHYKLENSHDAYLEASRHQQSLAHPNRLPAFITELSDLLALTTRRS